jgi:hypothetical protein
MSRLQKKPAAHKRGHPTLQNMNFFSFCGSFLPSWIRIRIPNTDPDPLARLNTDPIRIWIQIRIRNPAYHQLLNRSGEFRKCTYNVREDSYKSALWLNYNADFLARIGKNTFSLCRTPQDLYKNGIQRSNFLPFIDMLQEKSRVGRKTNE